MITDHTVFDGDSEKENQAQLHETFKILINQKIEFIDIKETQKGLKTILQFTEEFSFDLSPHPNDPD